jgi:hypothetical protein
MASPEIRVSASATSAVRLPISPCSRASSRCNSDRRGPCTRPRSKSDWTSSTSPEISVRCRPERHELRLHPSIWRSIWLAVRPVAAVPARARPGARRRGCAGPRPVRRARPRRRSRRSGGSEKSGSSAPSRSAVQTCGSGEDLRQLAFHDRQFRAQEGAVEPDQNVARRDAISVSREDLAHHAAIGMLDHLALALDLDDTGRDDGAGDLGAHAPGADAAEHREDGGEAERTSGTAHSMSPCAALIADLP